MWQSSFATIKPNGILTFCQALSKRLNFSPDFRAHSAISWLGIDKSAHLGQRRC